MPDTLNKLQRSYAMSRIRSFNTHSEIRLKPIMKSLGFAYQPKKIYGRPDFANKASKVAVFIDGCFWHKCPKHFINPKSNSAYWNPKITRNVRRDKEVNKTLEKEGWRVIRVWEHNLIGF